MNARPRRRSGNLSALKVEVWAAIRAASALLDDPETTPELKLRAASAVATAGAVYAKLLTGEPGPPEPSEAAAEDDVITVHVRGTNGHHSV